MIPFPLSKELILPRKSLKDNIPDIEGKTIIIGFNEPQFKMTTQGDEVDSKLNARLITYFLPAVEIARKQKQRPRFLIVSGLNQALKWNATTENERKIMTANNAIKFDFLRIFFDNYFQEEFSLIEYLIPQDILKVPEGKFLALWNLIQKKYPEEIQEIRFQLTKFTHPKNFNVRNFSDLNDEQREQMQTIDITNALKYAIGHLFTFGDINFEGNYIHNTNGFVSIGGDYEIFFNQIRSLTFEVIRDFGEIIFDREVIVMNNYKIVLENAYKVPPPYNGMFHDKKGFLEVTYENGKGLGFYDEQPKLREQMEYMYENLLTREIYQQFWETYKTRYFDLKERYREAYNIDAQW